MELSSEEVKNLLGVLRTLNLTTTAVSLGLLSNFLFAWTNLPARQRTELRDLSHIIDQTGHYSATSLFNEVTKQAGISPGNYELTVSIDPAARVFANPINIPVKVPSVVHPIISFSQELLLSTPIGSHELPIRRGKKANYCVSPNDRIEEIATLGEMIWFWNALAEARYLLVVRPSLGF